MITVVFPDPLVWQAGPEWGVEGLAVASRQGVPLAGVFPDAGPLLEAVAFAAVQLGIRAQIELVGAEEMARWLDRARLLAFPRVVELDRVEPCRALGRGRLVVSSEPGFDLGHHRLHRAPPRDPVAFARALIEAASTLPAVGRPVAPARG